MFIRIIIIIIIYYLKLYSVIVVFEIQVFLYGFKGGINYHYGAKFQKFAMGIE